MLNENDAVATFDKANDDEDKDNLKEDLKTDESALELPINSTSFMEKCHKQLGQQVHPTIEFTLYLHSHILFQFEIATPDA